MPRKMLRLRREICPLWCALISLFVVLLPFRKINGFTLIHQANTPYVLGRSTSTQSADTDVQETTKLSLPPGRPTLPIINILFDDTAQLLNPRNMKLLKRKEKYGPIYKTNFLFRPTVFMSDQTSIQELGRIEGMSSRKFKAFFPPHHQKLFGSKSIILQSGETHKRIRSLVMSSMTPAIINSYQPLVEKSVKDFFISFGQTTGEYTPMVPIIRTFFMSVVLQTVLGTTDVSNDLIEDIRMWSRGLLAPPLTFLPWTTAGKAIRARKRIASQLSKLMNQSSPSMDEKQSRGILYKLQTTRDKETGASLSREEILDNLFTLVFAGADTSSSAAISIWILLSKHPTLKQQLKTATDEQIDTFVCELLEAFPPAPFNMRSIIEEIEVGGYRIPAKWQVCYEYAAALDDIKGPTSINTEDVGSKSAGFVSPTVGEKTEIASSSIVFGSGPRKCPGRYLAVMELKVFLKALIEQEWELDLNQDLTQAYTPGYFPVDGLRVKRIIYS